MSEIEKSAEERLRFVKHKGHAIYLIDVSHCAAKELLVLLEMIRADIARHAPGSVLTLVDVTGAEIDKPPMSVKTNVHGIFFHSPPSSVNLLWPVMCNTAPQPMNRRPL